MKRYVNNRGFGENGDFDGLKNAFQCKELLSTDTIQIKNIPFQLHHTHQLTSYNDATARGQVIKLPSTKNTGAIYLLASSNHGPVKTPLTITYQDGSTSTTTLDIPDWQEGHSQHIERLDIHPCQTTLNQQGLLFIIPLYVDPSKKLSHLTLPYTYPIGWFAPALHIFAITVYPKDPYSTTQLANIISVKPTTQYLNHNDREYQWINVRVHNIHQHFLHNIEVDIKTNNIVDDDESIQVTTYKPGLVHRLAPGHIHVVQVAIALKKKKNENNQPLFKLDHDCLVTITSKSWLGIKKTIAQDNSLIDVGIKNYKDDYSSLSQHQAPKWLKQAKFGIFIHWGLYSVPSWGSVGRSYAEWYWWQLMQKNSPTSIYHKYTYGERFEYDDFIDLWNTSSFDAYQWLDLIDASRAKYYVFTTKHHDGIALFDTKVTQRSTVHFKQQDFVRKLTDVSKKSFPHLKRGLYFSLPEWYHPSYFDPGYGWRGPPKNAYNDTEVPYTGITPINDFVNELQVPQFFELIDNYDPDILWCDLNGINNSTVWQTKYFNHARKQGKEVAINDRCGNGISDFMTSEYQILRNTPSRFWEATRGIDPYSFGYNHATAPEQYATTTDLIHELIDVIANGGNFLLNIGPDSFGNVPIVMKERLIEIGEWIDKVKPSIFDSEPYWINVQDTSTPGQTIRFTIHRHGTSFYIFVLEKPLTGRVTIKVPIPLHPNAIVRLLGDPLKEQLDWKVWSNGRFIIEVPNRILNLIDHAWVFEISYP